MNTARPDVHGSACRWRRSSVGMYILLLALAVAPAQADRTVSGRYAGTHHGPFGERFLPLSAADPVEVLVQDVDSFAPGFYPHTAETIDNPVRPEMDLEWIGPAIRVTLGPNVHRGPNAGDRQPMAMLSTALHGGTNFNYPPFAPEAQPILIPETIPAECVTAPRFKPVRTDYGGDYTFIRDFRLTCPLGGTFTMHYFNRRWAVQRVPPAKPEGLRSVLNKGFSMKDLACTLRCWLKVTATVSKSTAKKLGLSSTKVGAGKIAPQHPVSTPVKAFETPRIPLTEKAWAALRRTSSVDVTFDWSAVGSRPGETASGSYTATYRK